MPELSPSARGQVLHRLGFAFKRPKNRLLKADEAKREAFVAEYAALRGEARQSGARIFFADEAHFRADAELRGKWVLKGKPALVDSTSLSLCCCPAIPSPKLKSENVTLG